MRFRILLLFPLLWSCQKADLPATPPGSFDIRPAVEKNQVINLDGLFRFYPSRFLGAKAEAGQNQPYSYVPVPGQWNQYEANSSNFGATGFATYEAKLLVPEEATRLAIRVNDIGTAYRIYADNELMGQRGQPATSAKEHVPSVGEDIYHFKTSGPTVTLRLEISNFSYRKGGIWNSLSVGPELAVQRENWKESSVQILLVGILLIMGLYHSGFFLIRKQETSLFFFGISCFLIAIRELTLGPRLLSILLPSAPWVFLLRLEYTCFFLALPAFAFYINALYPGYFWKSVGYVFLVISVIFSAIVWLTGPLTFTELAPLSQYVMLAFILYSIVAVFRALFRSEPGSITLLISGTVVALAAVNDSLLVRHYYDGPRLIALGQIQFVIAQAFMLAVRFSRNMRKIEAYNRTVQQRNDNLRQQKSSLELRAIYDELTGLGNRTLLMDTLEKQLKDNPDQKFSLLLMDLDNFRLLNDTAGHVVGDTILLELARRIKYTVPSRDQLFRLEGDEFAILHKEGSSGQSAYQFSHRIREALAQPVDVGDRTFQTTASIGIAHYPDHGQTPLMIFRSADSAVMQAKSQGKNREEEFDSGQDLEHRIRLDLASRLDQAIRKNELELYFQPIVNLRDGRALGAEALLRWNEPELGFVAPDVFIPIAEETGQIRVLGDLVLETAALTLEKWNRIVPDFSISVNISPGQLGKSSLLSSIRDLLSRHRLSPRNLKLEITENLLLEDKNINLLRQVREMGIRLVMDDFGTGYSSFAYLQKFLFDILKIDKSFLLHLHDEPSNPHLVEAMVRMAHSLQMEVVAEGIETDEICDFLKNLGCEMGQGYLYAPALTATDFEEKYFRNSNRPLNPSVA